MRLIDADALIYTLEDRLEKIRNRYGDDSGEAGVCAGALHLIRVQPTIEPEPKWIPFKTRPLTEEEKDNHPEWDCILDCKLPDDGQRILVSIDLRGHEAVQQDEFYSDDGSYLDSGYEIGTEATAWMPLPSPYREEGEQE